MSDLIVPPDHIPWAAWLDKVRHTAGHDLPTARRAILLRLIWQQAHQTRENLIRLVETLLQQPCFGPATFPHDIALVRQVLAGAGYRLRYSRQPKRKGYYIEGRPVLDEKIRRMIAGAVAEVDPAQIAIYRQLTPAQRVAQLGKVSDWLRVADQRRTEHKEAA